MTALLCKWDEKGRMPSSGTRLNCIIPVHMEAGPAHLLIQAPAQGKISRLSKKRRQEKEKKKGL